MFMQHTYTQPNIALGLHTCQPLESSDINDMSVITWHRRSCSPFPSYRCRWCSVDLPPASTCASGVEHSQPLDFLISPSLSRYFCFRVSDRNGWWFAERRSDLSICPADGVDVVQTIWSATSRRFCKFVGPRCAEVTCGIDFESSCWRGYRSSDLVFVDTKNVKVVIKLDEKNGFSRHLNDDKMRESNALGSWY